MRRQHCHHGFILAFTTLMLLLLACGSLFKIYTLAIRDAYTETHNTQQAKASLVFASFVDLDLPTLDPNPEEAAGHHAATPPPPPPPPLRRRKLGWTSSKTFRKALQTGQKILASIDGAATGDPKPRPKFDKVSDLQDWGWTSTEIHKVAIKRKLGNFVTVLEEKRIDVDKPSMRGVTLTHARETVHGGVRYPPTGGTYDMILDPEQGILIPTKSYGPAWYVEQKQGPAQNWPPNAPLPQLGNWADIAFLAWLEHTTPENRQNLHHVLNINAINAATVDVATEALRKVGVKSAQPPAWPGYCFARVSAWPFSANRAYAAVLGTPNGLGTGWLVAQRQKALGKKRIGGITVFDSSGFLGGDGQFQLSIWVEVV